ncbi:serine/threonine-protein kinase gin4 [Rhodosporidiobolus nylandii]
MAVKVTVPLRPPPPVPSPAHGRRPPPAPSSSGHLHPSSPSAAAFLLTLPDDPDATPAEPPAPLPTEDDWYLFPAPTREAARLGLPPVDVKAVLERMKRAKGRGLQRREWKMLGEWRVGEALGKGTSGHVRLARSTRTAEFAAVKKVLRLPANDKHAKSFHREISLMKLVAPHPHLVELLDVFETPSHLYLVTEYCPDGELFHLIVKRQLAPHEIHRFYTQLISALQHLARFSLSHRDVKFENLLLVEARDGSGSYDLKLSDMGMATFQPEGDMLKTSCGSPHYAAPEVIRGTPYHGSLADVWSSGVVLYAMFARRLPFDDEHIPTLLEKIKSEGYEMHESIGGAARDLVRRCLEKDTARRIALDDVTKHPYLRPLPHVAPPLSLEAIYPPRPVQDSFPLEAGDLDELVLESLAVVLKVGNAEAAQRMVVEDRGRARLFYSVLRGFREPRRLRAAPTTDYEPSVRVGDQSLPISVSPSGTSIRRSLSLPDLNALFTAPHKQPGSPPVKPPPTAAPPHDPESPSRPPLERRKTEPASGAVEAPASPDQPPCRYSVINAEYAFPGPSPRVPPTPTQGGTTITSAPPHMESFAIRPLPISPLTPGFGDTPRPPMTRRSSARPTTSTSGTRSLPVSPVLNQDPAFAAAAEQAKASARPSIDFGAVSRRLSISALQRGPSKKASMHQRLRSLFHAGGGKRASVSSVAEEAAGEAEKVKPPFPPSPIPPPAAPAVSIVRPPSPAPSRASSMLKRSSAYRSFDRALDGKPPKSPDLTEFGEILSLGASSTAEARARHNIVVKRKASSSLRSDSRSHARSPLALSPPVPAPMPEVHSFLDARTGLSKASSTPTPAHSPMSRRKKRPPTLLTIDSVKAQAVPGILPSVSPMLQSHTHVQKRPSVLGLGRPPRRAAASPQQQESPDDSVLGHAPALSLTPASPTWTRPAPEITSPDESDPEDPFSLISALRQYPYRSTSYGSNRASSADSAPHSRASSMAFAGGRNVSGSTRVSTNPTSILSARSPRIGDDGFDSDAAMHAVSGSSEYANSYMAALRRQRDLEADLRKVQLENKLLQAAIEARDDELELLRRSERRLTRVVSSSEQVVRELSAEREELEELVRRLDWEKHRSFFNFDATDEGDDDEVEDREGDVDVERKMREDEWLQSLRRQEDGWRVS